MNKSICFLCAIILACEFEGTEQPGITELLSKSKTISAGGTTSTAIIEDDTCSYLLTSESVCDICTGTSCCEVANSCLKDQECVNLSSCNSACTTDYCTTNCAEQYSSAYVTLSELTDCMLKNCYNECS